MSKTELVKVFGGPGTGKTTTLVGNTDIDGFEGIMERLFRENSPQELMLIAYTRSAADEAKNRLYELTDVNKGVLDKRITTIHSLAMGFQNVWPNKICEIRKFKGNNDYGDFCERMDLDYSTSSDDDDDIMAADEDDGNAFFTINSWLKSNMMSLRDWQECPAASDFTADQDFVELGLEWIKYKNRNNVYEFDDVIQMCVDDESTVDARELFVDECQDLYPLQQAFLDNQFGEVDRIWLAGDDDQTIYEWSGADPSYFINAEPNVNGIHEEFWDDKTGYWDDDGVYILDQSWRMPSEVLELSRLCIDRVGERQEKTIKPHHDGGEITFYQWPSTSQIIRHINHEDTFILFRANFHCQAFGKELIFNGIPFQDRFNTWREETLDLRDAIATLKNDEPAMTGSQAYRLIHELPDRLLDEPNAKHSFKQSDFVETSEVVGATKLPFPERHRQLQRWFVEYEDRNYYQRRAIEENINHDLEHLKPDGVTVETIHWSKGKEADTVILSLDSSGTVIEQMPRGGMSDAERRLYYVGMSRTENELVIAQDLVQEAPSLTTTQVFGTEWNQRYEFADR